MPRENLSLGFLTSSDTNRAGQPQKMARGLKFCILKVEGLYYLSSVLSTSNGEGHIMFALVLLYVTPCMIWGLHLAFVHC